MVDLTEDGVLASRDEPLNRDTLPCEGLGRDDLFPLSAADICGIPEYRLTFDMVLLVALATELARLLAARPLPGGVITSDDAGELPGVPPILAVTGLSPVTILEPESWTYW